MESRDPYMLALAGLWLTLPLTALNVWRAWARLPLRMATHFDAAWRPNGWSSRDDAIRFIFITVTVVLLVVTLACYGVRQRKPSHSWPVLVITYLVVGFIGWETNSLVFHNVVDTVPIPGAPS